VAETQTKSDVIDEARARIAEALALVGMEDFMTLLEDVCLTTAQRTDAEGKAGTRESVLWWRYTNLVADCDARMHGRRGE
jgi:hypothetical protein